MSKRYFQLAVASVALTYGVSVLATPATMTVKVSPLSYQTLKTTVTTYGVVDAPKSVNIIAQSAGAVTSVNFKAGQFVKSGQLLFTLKTSDINNQPDKLKSQMEDDKKTYGRYLKIQKAAPGTVAASTLESAKFKYEQSLNQYQTSLRLSRINAPSDGLISDAAVARGTVVASGDVLATISVRGGMQIKYQLPSQYARDVRLGQVVIFSEGGHVFNGKVTYIDPALNADNYSINLKAKLADEAVILPNTFGKVSQILNPAAKILAVKQGLVLSDSQGFYVYTLKDNKISKAYFTPQSVMKSGYVAIAKGLQEGMLIVTDKLSQLSPGQTVKVEK